jgi:hypothetical protein
MKKLLLIVLVLLVGCRKNDFPAPINLGVQSQSTAITKVHPIISNGQITVDMNVTSGAKYSLQVTDLLDNEIKTFGFTADSDIYTRKLDLTDLKNGDYNLVLIDIAGKETRTNIIIKK